MVESGDSVPSGQELERALARTILDTDGKKHTLDSLVKQTEGTRLLVVFIRHFFCGTCHDYVSHLSSSLSPSRLANASSSSPPSMIIIGCGAPSLIQHYKEQTSCPYPMYADPTGKIYKALGMVHSYTAGNREEGYEYTNSGVVAQVTKSAGRMLHRLSGGHFDALKGGRMTQIGGEFLFDSSESEPKVQWCHRMKDIRDHSKLETLERVLELEGEQPQT